MYTELVPLPASGRIYVTARRVHLGDVDASGRMRLEAMARFVQDVATDDALEAGLSPADGVWVVRRLTMTFDGIPRYRDWIELTTFCSGTGPRWVERRTTLAVDGGATIEAAAIWVLLDPDSGRPLTLPPVFHEMYGETTGDRKVSGRLVHRDPPASDGARAWPLREGDFDVLDHVNNARYWEAVEDELVLAAPGRVPIAAEAEYRGAVERGEEVALVSRLRPLVETAAPDEAGVGAGGTGQAGAAELDLWLSSGAELRMSARVRLRGPADADPA
jgi:acyl-ACP thioesterase